MFPPRHAGASTQAIELSKFLRNENVESFFFAADFDHSPVCEKYQNIPIYRFKTTQTSRLGYFLYALKVLYKLIILRNQYDIIHFHSTKPFYFLVIILSKFLRKRTVMTFTLLGNDDPSCLKEQSLLWRIEGMMTKYLDRIVCISTALKNSCLAARLPESKLVKIPYGVDVNRFSPLKNTTEIKQYRRRLKLPTEAFIACFIGRICRRKGCDLLFDAWERIQEENKKALLLLVGPYDQNPYFVDEEDFAFASRVQKLVRERNAKNIVFAGQVGHEQINEYLSISDLFVFPSKSEGFGIVLIEAMASGIPVISTKIEGTTEDIIDNEEVGVIVNDRDGERFANEIIKLIRNRRRRSKLGENGIKKAQEKFSMGLIAKQHRSLYENIV